MRERERQKDGQVQTNEDRLTDKQHGNHYHMVFPQWNRSWSLPSVHSIRKPSFCWTHCGLVSVSSLTCQLGTPVYVNKENKAVWTKDWSWVSSLTCQVSITVYINKYNKPVCTKEWIWTSSVTCQLSVTVYINKENKTVWSTESLFLCLSRTIVYVNKKIKLWTKEWIWASSLSFLCLKSTETRRPFRDGDEWERGTEELNLKTGANPEDRGCRGPPPEQKIILSSVRPPHHAVAVPTAMQNSHKDNARISAVGKQLKQKKSSSLSVAPHHLPALDLFWASFFVRVQLISLLLISPGLS